MHHDHTTSDAHLSKKTMFGHLEVPWKKLDNQLFKPLLIIPIDKAVVEHSGTFVRPQPNRRLHRGAAGGGDHQKALEHLGDISEVECVVEPRECMIIEALSCVRYNP